LLFPYLGVAWIFKCPIEPQWQCGYGMNYSEGSSMARPDAFITEPSERLVVWDHRRSPGCSVSRMSAPRLPWLPFSNVSHYPTRHEGYMNGLFYDGHAAAVQPGQLRLKNFREPGVLPA
jgi:prepilin-type processing-associated H-X9-DG protein